MDDATKEALRAVEKIVARTAATLRRDRGPVNLQAAWLRIAEASIRCGSSAHGAASDADSIIAAFKERAGKLAEDSVSLPYLGSAGDDGRDPEPETPAN